MMNLENKIDEFIHRRFPIDCNWLNGNCYWFAHILCEAFGLKMYYLEIDNHFVAKDDNDNYYDWSGKIIPDENPILWEDMAEYIGIDKDDFKTYIKDNKEELYEQIKDFVL